MTTWFSDWVNFNGANSVIHKTHKTQNRLLRHAILVFIDSFFNLLINWIKSQRWLDLVIEISIVAWLEFMLQISERYLDKKWVNIWLQDLSSKNTHKDKSS